MSLKETSSSQELSVLLEKFYHNTAHLVFGYCKKKGLSQVDTEDIVQIVYTQIYKKKNQYNEQHEALAWLFVITNSETKDYLKKNKTYLSYLEDYTLFQKLVEDVSQSAEQSPSNLQKNEGVTSASLQTTSLSPQEKKVLALRYTSEKDFEDIAEELRLSPSNVRKIVSRALAKLRKENL